MAMNRLFEDEDGGVQRGGIEAEHDAGAVQYAAKESEQEPERRGLQRPGWQPKDNWVSGGVTATRRLLSPLTTSTRNMENEVNENPQVREIGKLRVLCGMVVNHPRVQLLIIALISTNAIMMGMATFDFVTDNPSLCKAFELTDVVFLSIFTAELCLHFAFRGVKLFRHGWLTFDFVVVVVSWSFSQEGTIVRSFRIFRALRIIHRVETMRSLVTALFVIMPRMGAIAALLLLIFYVFAVLFTQLLGHLDLGGEYPNPFSRLDHSLITLFIFMTIEWADISRAVVAEVWWAWLPIVIFVIITVFIMVNLIIAVVCDAVAVIENRKDPQGDLLSMASSRDEFQPDKSKVGVSPRATNNDGTVLHEGELMENLSERLSSVQNRQKDLLLTLQTLVKDSHVLLPEVVLMPQAVLTPETAKLGENPRPEVGGKRTNT